MNIKLNENEKLFVSKIEYAMRYCKGELELDLDIENDMWVAWDYREDLEGAFSIDVKGFNDKMISVSEAEFLSIDVRKCCDFCGISYVG